MPVVRGVRSFEVHAIDIFGNLYYIPKKREYATAATIPWRILVRHSCGADEAATTGDLLVGRSVIGDLIGVSVVALASEICINTPIPIS